MESAPTTPYPVFDRAKSGLFVERLKAAYQGTVVTMMIDLGHRTGLLNELAAGPATSSGLATRAGVSERHVREWLSTLAVGGVVTYDAASRTFTLPAEHTFWLTGPLYTNLAPMSGMLTGLAPRLDDVTEAFRSGGGVAYANYRPHFTHAMDAIGRARFDQLLVKAYLPTAAGLTDRLAAGSRAGDVGCGTGHCLNLMAAAFPTSEFVGFDLSDEAIALGRAEASAMGLRNVSFEVTDVLKLPVDPAFDVLFAFDAIHDQADPAGVLARIHSALRPGGELFMVDIKASSNLEDNIAEPDRVMIYGLSVMHCMEVSLASGGAGLGTAWGTQLATQMLHDAGFAEVGVHDIEADPTNCIYVCR